MKYLLHSLPALIILAISHEIYAEDYIGKYISTDGIDEIEINDSCFVYRNPLLELYGSPIYHICGIKKLTDNFFEINSLESGFKIDEGVSLEYSEPSNPDSISVCINTSSKMSTYDVHIYSRGLWEESSSFSTDFQIVNGNGYTLIPRTGHTQYWRISISPKYSDTDPLERLTKGGTRDYFLTGKIDMNKDVLITLPALTDEFFLRHYIRGEYIRIVGDTLYWRGNAYEKGRTNDDHDNVCNLYGGNGKIRPIQPKVTTQLDKKGHLRTK